jgi:hypothetical protein
MPDHCSICLEKDEEKKERKREKKNFVNKMSPENREKTFRNN